MDRQRKNTHFGRTEILDEYLEQGQATYERRDFREACLAVPGIS